MARRDEIHAQIAALQKELEGDGEDDYEVTIKDGDKAFTGPYSKVRKWAQKNLGIDLDDVEEEPEDEGGKKTPAKSADGKVVPAHFRRRA